MRSGPWTLVVESGLNSCPLLGSHQKYKGQDSPGGFQTQYRDSRPRNTACCRRLTGIGPSAAPANVWWFPPQRPSNPAAGPGSRWQGKVESQKHPQTLCSQAAPAPSADAHAQDGQSGCSPQSRGCGAPGSGSPGPEAPPGSSGARLPLQSRSHTTEPASVPWPQPAPLQRDEGRRLWEGPVSFPRPGCAERLPPGAEDLVLTWDLVATVSRASLTSHSSLPWAASLTSRHLKKGLKTKQGIINTGQWYGRKPANSFS